MGFQTIPKGEKLCRGGRKPGRLERHAGCFPSSRSHRVRPTRSVNPVFHQLPGIELFSDAAYAPSISRTAAVLRLCGLLMMDWVFLDVSNVPLICSHLHTSKKASGCRCSGRSEWNTSLCLSNLDTSEPKKSCWERFYMKTCFFKIFFKKGTFREERN